ncbi:hypothetical protein J6P92_02770, partial [bacterium]|nr:hypothetical protein [bacterium]
YSLLNQGFRKMMADDGVEFIMYTEVWRAIRGGSCLSNYDISSAECKDFYAQLKKYFKIVRIGRGTDIGSSDSEVDVYKYKYRNLSDVKIYPNNIIHLSNGAMIWSFIFNKELSINSNCDALHSAGGHMCGVAGVFYIDVNGNRGPNEFGKDIFYFLITER